VGRGGHPGAGRDLRPRDQIDEIVDHYPDACGGCGREFTDRQRRPERRFGRHQIAELPPISVIWTEHRTHQLRCRHCRARTSARLPEQISSYAFGPRLEAAIVALTARHRISRRGICELARDLFGVTLSTGAVDAICQRASAALAGPHCQLQDWVLDQGVVHVDETGWRTRGEGRALWTATTPGATFLQIAEHCNREQFNALVGTGYAGIVVSDRWNGYEHLDPDQRQVCWSHIQRDFRRHAEGLAEQKSFGEQGLELTRGVFAAWRAYQHEHHDRDRLAADIAPIQTGRRRLLEQASPKSQRTRWHRRFANNLLKVWPALWRFVSVEAVEPTNNPAERALRAPVIHRKLSLGSQSDNGERFAERALSAAATCRLQSRSLFTYLSELLLAHSRGDPFPALA
jgi:transposase